MSLHAGGGRPAWPLLAAALVLVAGGCGSREPSGGAGDPEGPPVRGGTVVVGQISDFDSLNDLASEDASADDVMREMLYLSLVEYDEKLNLTPRLARSWEFGADSLSITFHLRTDVRWHDGVPTTAADVKWTLECKQDPAYLYGNRSSLDYMKRAVVLNDSTIRVDYTQTYSEMLSDVGYELIMPEHLLASVPAADMAGAAYNHHPVGNGPFKFSRWVPQQECEFVANDGWPDGRPHLDRVIFRVVPNQSALLLNLETGEIDCMEAIPPREVERISHHPKLRTFRYPERGYRYIGWNLRSPLFASRKVRQAMTMAIDRQEIVDALLFGLGKVTANPMMSASWAYAHDIPPWPYDPARARKMLEEEGWRDTDGDGYLDKNGKPFQFEIKTNMGNQIREDCLVMVQADLKEIGVRAVPRLREWTVFVDETNAKQFDAFLLGWIENFSVNPTDLFHSASIEGKYNQCSYANEEVDKLIEAGRREVDREKAIPIWHRFQEILHEDQPYTIMYELDRVNGVSRRVHGVKMDIRSFLVNVEEWWIPEGERRYSS